MTAQRPTTARKALEDVLDTLKVQPSGRTERGERRYLGRSSRRSLPFVFGGQLVAQALSAAYATVPADLRVHVLHAHFLESGDPGAPLLYDVEDVRERGTIQVRRVRASQRATPASRDGHRDDAKDIAVFEASMSFATDRPGLEHSRDPAAQLAHRPDDLPPLDRWLGPHVGAIPDWWTGPMPVDLRYLEQPPHVPVPASQPRPRQDLWMRTAGPLPADPRIHDCMLTYATDLTLLDAVLVPHARSWYDGGLRGASLDHSIWFHRRLRFDDWVFYEQRSPAAFGGRGLAQGDIFDQHGRLCASAAQQGLITLLR